MPGQRRCWMLAAAMMVRICILSSLTPVAWGQTNDVSAAEVLFGIPQSGPRAVEGITQCYRCHRELDGQDDLPLPPGVKDDGWVLRNELITWVTKDRHYQAFTVLLGERSRNMARVLGIVDGNGESVIHRDARCLACHSAVPVHAIQSERLLVVGETMADPLFNVGVSCEGCHGPAKDAGDSAPGWESIHDDEDGNWRRRDARSKFEDYGFWDVRSPRTQAKICLSCHLGNVEQGKIITHEMYAAGHPPLPSFELGAFVAQQPRHWRNLEDKAPQIRDPVLAALGVEFDPRQLHRTRAILVSAMTSAAESMKLTADLMSRDVSSPAGKPTWPELANYACYACHHDLQRDGWRQSRPRTATPGRPTVHEWPWALAGVAATFLGAQEEFEQHVNAVLSALDRQPFGHRGDLESAARGFAAAADRWAVELSQRDIDISQGPEVLKLIARSGSTRTVDYDAARQLVWAYERVLADIDGSERRRAEPPRIDLTPAQIRAASTPPPWQGWLKSENAISPQQEILKQLESVLVLDLRQGRMAPQQLPGESRPRPQTEVELNLTLPKIAAYDPELVREAFGKLLELSER